MIFLTSYNANQLDKMQREAVKRVNEMHRRSQQIVGVPPLTKESEDPKKEKRTTPSDAHEQAVKPPTKNNTEQPFSNLLGGFFEQGSGLGELSKLWNFKIDEEKALIGIIIYILAKNNADPKLLIGLGYLIL